MKIDCSKRSKGIGDLVPYAIMALLIIGVVVIFYILMMTKFLDIRTIVMEAGVERHTLNLAQVLLSYDKLVYVEEDYFSIHRGIFVKEKLDEQFKDGSELTNELGYPDSVILLYVKDFDANKEWALRYKGPFNLEGSKAASFIECLNEKTEFDVILLFQMILSPISHVGPWDYYTIAECTSSFASDYGTSVRRFPVAIKDGNEIHAGILVVTIDEWTLI